MTVSKKRAKRFLIFIALNQTMGELEFLWYHLAEAKINMQIKNAKTFRTVNQAF
jgi:hypothetical protein